MSQYERSRLGRSLRHGTLVDASKHSESDTPQATPDRSTTRERKVSSGKVQSKGT